MKPNAIDRLAMCLISCIATAAVALPAGLGLRSAVAQVGAGDAELQKDAQDRFKPLPRDMGTAELPVSPERVALGRMLFFDPRISVDGTTSCARCHLPTLYGTDALPKSVGVHNQRVPRNPPTVLNAAINVKQHWDGVFESVEDQAKRSLLSPASGNPDFATAMARVQAIGGYTELFEKAFPTEREPVSADNWGKAIGAYERTLVSPSRFDDYLRGNSNALTAAERKGLRTFTDTGCADCHNGAGVGGRTYRKFGEFDDYWTMTGSKDIDKGRFGVTKNSDDLYKFKVPSLRNVAMTPPYFHDGSVDSLSKAVLIMGKLQLNSDLSEREVGELVAFLKCLTGKLPETFERAPVLPAGAFAPPVTGAQSKPH
jgi:cytochrome c peroxidase